MDRRALGPKAQEAADHGDGHRGGSPCAPLPNLSPCQIISRSNRPADFARRARVDPRASPARARIESTAFERFSRRRVPASRATARVVPARALDAAEEGIESSPRMNSMKSPTRPSDPAIHPSTYQPLTRPIPSHPIKTSRIDREPRGPARAAPLRPAHARRRSNLQQEGVVPVPRLLRGAGQDKGRVAKERADLPEGGAVAVHNVITLPKTTTTSRRCFCWTRSRSRRWTRRTRSTEWG